MLNPITDPNIINMTGIPAPLTIITTNLQNLFSTLSLLVGGVVGIYFLYLLFFVLQWRERFKIRKGLEEIASDLANIKTQLKNQEEVSNKILELEAKITKTSARFFPKKTRSKIRKKNKKEHQLDINSELSKASESLNK